MSVYMGIPWVGPGAILTNRPIEETLYKPNNKWVYPRLRDPNFDQRGREITKRISWDFR